MAQIIGRLTKDAKVLTGSNNREFIAFTIAENFPYKNKEGKREQQTTFIDCAYGRSIKIAPYLTKGTIVVVNGRLKPHLFTDKEGTQKAGIQMQVNDLTLQGGGAKPQTTPAPETAAAATETNDDLPF